MDESDAVAQTLILKLLDIIKKTFQDHCNSCWNRNDRGQVYLREELHPCPSCVYWATEHLGVKRDV